MKTIIMPQAILDKVNGGPRSRVPLEDAEAACAQAGGRLPTVEECRAVEFIMRPSKQFYLAEWTSSFDSNGARLIYLFGAYPGDFKTVVRTDTGNSLGHGFRCAIDVEDDMPVPREWIVYRRAFEDRK